jgi:hypothetical protein
MSTCPSSCTGTCPEIVPVTINQTVIDLGTEADVVDFVGTGTGSKYDFNLGYVALEILLVSVGSADQAPPAAYSVATTTTTVVTFTTAPANGETVHIKYLKEI